MSLTWVSQKYENSQILTKLTRVSHRKAVKIILSPLWYENEIDLLKMAVVSQPYENTSKLTKLTRVCNGKAVKFFLKKSFGLRLIWEWDLNWTHENSNQTNHIWERKGSEKDFEKLRNENEMDKD